MLNGWNEIQSEMFQYINSIIDFFMKRFWLSAFKTFQQFMQMQNLQNHSNLIKSSSFQILKQLISLTFKFCSLKTFNFYPNHLFSPKIKVSEVVQ